MEPRETEPQTIPDTAQRPQTELSEELPSMRPEDTEEGASEPPGGDSRTEAKLGR